MVFWSSWNKGQGGTPGFIDAWLYKASSVFTLDRNCITFLLLILVGSNCAPGLSRGDDIVT